MVVSKEINSAVGFAKSGEYGLRVCIEVGIFFVYLLYGK